MLLQDSDLGRGSSCGPAAASAPLKSPLLCIHCAPGKAYSLGRAEYGRLGLGTGAEEKSTPTVIPELPSITSVACGASVGYAVSTDGECPGLGSLPSVPSSPLHPALHTITTHCQLGWDWSQVLVPITWGQLGSGCSDVFVGPWQQGWSCGVDQEGVVGLTTSSLTPLMADICALGLHLPVCSVCRKEGLEWAVGFVFSPIRIKVPWLCDGTSVGVASAPPLPPACISDT